MYYSTSERRKPRNHRRKKKVPPNKLDRITEAIAANSAEDLKALCVEEGGLLNSDLRKKAWPIILGEDVIKDIQRGRHPTGSGKNKFTYQIGQDANRSHNLLRLVPPSKKEGYVNRLLRLINGIFDEFEFLNYYQGYHDIAGVILMMFESKQDEGDILAKNLLGVITLSFLRDHLTPTLEGTLDHLRMLTCLLSFDNPEISFMMRTFHTKLPIFSLGWISTWFAHDALRSLFTQSAQSVPDSEAQTPAPLPRAKRKREKRAVRRGRLDPLMRLFDYIISQNSCAVIYTAAAVIRMGCEKSEARHLREAIGKHKEMGHYSDDYASLHTYMASLIDWKTVNQVDAIIDMSCRMNKLYPPEMLMRSYNRESIDTIAMGLSFDDCDIAHSRERMFVLISESSSIANFRIGTSVPKEGKSPGYSVGAVSYFSDLTNKLIFDLEARANYIVNARGLLSESGKRRERGPTIRRMAEVLAQSVISAFSVIGVRRAMIASVSFASAVILTKLFADYICSRGGRTSIFRIPRLW